MPIVKKLKIKCAICDTEFQYQYRSSRNRKFCSIKCVTNNSSNLRNCTCKECGNNFKRSSSSKGIFCSRACKYLGSRITDKERLIKVKKYFDENVVIKDGCWDWNGAISSNGYGAIGAGRKYKINAHRAAWLIYVGDIPDGMMVCHRCDNRTCNNYKDCLFLGSQKDNMRDAMTKGRMRGLFEAGSVPHNKIITPYQEEEIQNLRSKYTQREISKMLNLELHIIKDAYRKRNTCI